MLPNLAEYLASKEVSERFPHISTEDYKRSVLWVNPEGNVFERGEVVSGTLTCAPGETWSLSIYQNILGFALVAEWVYQVAAVNRKVIGTISQ